MSRSAESRAPAFLAAGAFLFFIVASAPHSVHHVFKPHGTPENCLVFSLAQGCHVAAVSAITIQAPEAPVVFVSPEGGLSIARRTAAPFSQRAPPAA
ncbi:MAG TPA: hypothetical protein VKH64_07070 [Candidatus Binatia bacterium]|nr:hypothetical protein [Candidatus Binatia bacterium]